MGKLRIGAILLLLGAPAFGATITVLTSNLAGGAPGGTVGWGYVIHNDTGNPIGNFSVIPFDSSFGAFGFYNDILGLVPDLIPTGDTTVLFNATDAQNCLNSNLNCDTAGLGEYVLDPGDLVGSNTTVTLTIQFNQCPTLSCSGPSGTLVDSGTGLDPVLTVDAIPEPGTLSSMGTAAALMGIFLYHRRRRKHSL